MGRIKSKKEVYIFSLNFLAEESKRKGGKSTHVDSRKKNFLKKIENKKMLK